MQIASKRCRSIGQSFHSSIRIGWGRRRRRWCRHAKTQSSRTRRRERWSGTSKISGITTTTTIWIRSRSGRSPPPVHRRRDRRRWRHGRLPERIIVIMAHWCCRAAVLRLRHWLRHGRRRAAISVRIAHTASSSHWRRRRRGIHDAVTIERRRRWRRWRGGQGRVQLAAERIKWIRHARFVAPCSI
jgi:hypothetical protein